MTCQAFWGSHSCDLERGHDDADRRHQCGLDTDEDGWCSVVERGDNGCWTVRYWPDDQGGQRFPVALYGPDVGGPGALNGRGGQG